MLGRGERETALFVNICFCEKHDVRFSTWQMSSIEEIVLNWVRSLVPNYRETAITCQTTCLHTLKARIFDFWLTLVAKTFMNTVIINSCVTELQRKNRRALSHFLSSSTFREKDSSRTIGNSGSHQGHICIAESDCQRRNASLWNEKTLSGVVGSVRIEQDRRNKVTHVDAAWEMSWTRIRKYVLLRNVKGGACTIPTKQMGNQKWSAENRGHASLLSMSVLFLISLWLPLRLALNSLHHKLFCRVVTVQEI